MLTLSPRTTALLLIDLQNGIVALPTAPYSGAEIVERSKKAIDIFRRAGASVILVNVAFSPDGADALKAPVDRSLSASGHSLPDNWSDLVEGLSQPSDIHVTKHQWGAFYGTDLDLQLRRRGITTIVLGGIATNMGVESTARAAHEHGYHVIFAEDLTSGLSEKMHHFSFENIFPLIGNVTESRKIILNTSS
ncbi:hydrolase [Saccharibacter sp. 17.LH.SD]|uniref:hydrolase n=1 Tax=Saccharibacter sp. 17.LH.SD TaxID=2689393 RepID=UPI00136C1C21|nr:hydrolase [Saccharibacter sp. 17.LH.SD]MXV44733.1 hydrolase [Saccharibacter sp. 17.LH.SD]